MSKVSPVGRAFVVIAVAGSISAGPSASAHFRGDTVGPSDTEPANATVCELSDEVCRIVYQQLGFVKQVLWDRCTDTGLAGDVVRAVDSELKNAGQRGICWPPEG